MGRTLCPCVVRPLVIYTSDIHLDRAMVLLALAILFLIVLAVWED